MIGKVIGAAWDAVGGKAWIVAAVLALVAVIATWDSARVNTHHKRGAAEQRGKQEKSDARVVTNGLKAAAAAADPRAPGVLDPDTAWR